MSDLVGNPEDRFSHVAAHILLERTGVVEECWTLTPVVPGFDPQPGRCSL